MANQTRRNLLKSIPAIGALVAAGGAKAFAVSKLPPLPFKLQDIQWYAVPKYSFMDRCINYELRDNPDKPLTAIEAIDQLVDEQTLKLVQAHGYKVKLMKSDGALPN